MPRSEVMRTKSTKAPTTRIDRPRPEGIRRRAERTGRRGMSLGGRMRGSLPVVRNQQGGGDGQAATAGMRRRMDVSGGERLPAIDRTGEGVVLGVGAGLPAVVDDPLQAGPRGYALVQAAAERQQHEVPGRVRETGGLPLAVDRPDPVVELVLVAVEIVPAAF